MTLETNLENKISYEMAQTSLGVVIKIIRGHNKFRLENKYMMKWWMVKQQKWLCEIINVEKLFQHAFDGRNEKNIYEKGIMHN